jgi:hypothetical protein
MAGERTLPQVHEQSASIALEWRTLAEQAWGALNFILAFYEPGQNYLDTNAWKQAEASGRRAHAALRAKLDQPYEAQVVEARP